MRRARPILACAAWLGAACAPTRPAAVADAPEPLPGQAPSAERLYTLWWRGARIGTAIEHERRTADGVRLVRRERIAVRRGDELTATELEIAIDADAALRATAVMVRERDGERERLGRAVRSPDGSWRIERDGEPARVIGGAAVPAELIPLWVRRDHRFAGDVLLPGRGFAVARGEVVARGDGRYAATVHTAGGDLASTIETDRDGDALRIVGADGVVARRASATEAAAPFAPADAVAAGTIAVAARAAPADPRRAVTLWLQPVERAAPPALPGQRIEPHGARWRVVLDGALHDGPDPGQRAGAATAIAALAHRVAVDTGGDCTAHALAFAAGAADAGVDTRIVTGFRVDGDRLVRHRWAIAWTGAAWMAVDPSFDEAPAAPRLLGLAVHGPSSEDLAVADAAYAGIAAATAAIE